MTPSTELVKYRVRGGFTTIDRKNEGVLHRHRWRVDQRGSIVADINRAPWRLYLHRIIMRCPKGMEVHHINGQRPDNYEANMVILTPEKHRQLHNYRER